MLQLIARLISNLSAVATVAGILFFSSISPPSIVRLALWLFGVLALAISIAELYFHMHTRPQRFEPRTSAIADYLVRWLNSGGKCAVFSRDMSWAPEGSDAEAVLRTKSRKGELVAFVGRRTPFIEELSKDGGEIHDYSAIGFKPTSRFTVIDYGQAGARVAIGVVEAGKLVIREFDARNMMLMALVNDLVSLGEHALREVK